MRYTQFCLKRFNRPYQRFVLLMAVLALLTSLASSQNAVSVTDTISAGFGLADRFVGEKAGRYGAGEVLVVLDIDNTLLTSEVDLGGDIWYSWQNGDLEIKPKRNQVVRCLYNDAIGLLYELGTMKLTDNAIPGYISSWQQLGITVFALTSRDPRTRAATERELAKRGIDFSSTGLRPPGEDLPVYQYKLQKEMSYINGIMMVTGMNKGEMLKHLLKKTGREFRSVVFIDDSRKNLDNVKESFKNDPSVDLTLIQYNRITEERKSKNGGVVLTAAQANRMARDWKKLNRMLNRIFPGRTGYECVSKN